MTDIDKKIIITKNKKNDNNGNKGIKIISKNFNIFSDVSNNVYNQHEFRNKNTNIINNEIKNKIILSYKVNSQTGEETITNNIRVFNLITKYNLKNNIKHFYFYKNGNRIIFTKSNAHVSNDLYLVDFSGVKIEDKTDWYVKINNKEVYSDEIKDNSFIELNYNFYNKYENSDYYKFKFRDFIDLSNILNISSRQTYNNDYQITYNNIDLNNDFISNSYINYNKSDFETIYCLSDNSVNVLTKSSTTSSLTSTLLQDICDNLLIYNKLGNNTTININYNTNDPNNYSLNDISINFEIIKTPNIYSKYYGKILLNSNFTYLNTNVLGNNTNIPNFLNDNSKVYLSLDNGITGLTQKKIFNNIKFTTDNENLNKIRKINFTKPANIRNKSSNYNNNYLLNHLSYNDNETNIFSVIKKLPRDGPTGLSNKIQDIDLINFFTSISNDDINKNIFLTGFKNIEVSNNNINYDFFDNSYNLSNVGISNDTIIKSIDEFRIIITPSNFTGLSRTTYNIEYDFRYNYNNEAFSTLLLTFTYNDSQNYISNVPLNFYKAILSNEYKTLEAGDFKDVACIFIYHDPYDEATNISFRYPNNNIEIIDNITIDNLSKAIELLPNANSATSNSIFIPARNGSNLSKKQIQGLIGFGKEGIPRLLSIEPYDDNSRIGRGFNNQFNLNDGTLDPSNLKLTNSQVVALKYNSQKHSSQKQTNNITNKRNFADLVKSSARSRNVNLDTPISCSNEPPNIPKEKYYTPFRMFKTNKGNYLRSGK